MASNSLLTPEHLLAFDPGLDPQKIKQIVEFVTVRAKRVAPCLKTTTDPEIITAAQGTMVRAALRWADQGSGALQQWTNVDGPFTRSASVDNRAGTSHGIFYPSEEQELKALCAPTGGSRRVASGWLL